ncbi:hypothetical protein [Pectobacterium carotovorum]|uniref:hypothetical protein n=1 Tax=Pectobacterium carotovorum TaxID=554 RepID=UPI001E395398|nr:hypothetical protein [Pectobacterium carotovorum]UFT92839.1 hypothetical protein LQF52_13265 [Pectobacterium carotovorum]GKX39558.1 lysozyme [Pectobacterium carotovorum subsp. carotovorum]GLX45712.1 lysozyme [Pectobacterium carotovorum subsp. carotovorum]
MFSDVKSLLIGLVAGIAIGWYVQGLRWDADAAERDSNVSVANEQRAETITSNVITSMRIINTITRANADAKQQIQNESETRIVYIRQSLSGERCAANPVPADVVNGLREHADRIRSGSGSANPR